MNYDHNQFLGLFKFQSGYRKFFLNSPKGYSLEKINAQTVQVYRIEQHIFICDQYYSKKKLIVRI